MKIKEYSAFVKLTADDGMYLYNGTMVREIVCVPIDMDYSNWSEIPKEEGDQIKAEQKIAEAKAREAEQEQAEE